jgi:small subunit ribosomal protein S20
VANIKSSQKAARQRITRTARNVARKTAMRSAVKKVRAAVELKNAKNAKAALPLAIRAIDVAASKGVIKRGTASRSVARLVVAVNALG